MHGMNGKVVDLTSVTVQTTVKTLNGKKEVG